MKLLKGLGVSLLSLTLLLFAVDVQSEVRSDLELCDELTEVVNESVDHGLLTQREADRLSDKCYHDL